jgi:hypothetical protein
MPGKPQDSSWHSGCPSQHTNLMSTEIQECPGVMARAGMAVHRKA